LQILLRCLLFTALPTKKRHSAKEKLAAGIRDRLEEIRKDMGLNYSEFADVAGVPRTQYNAWRNDGVVPGGQYIREMATNLKITTDWLLGIPSAPRYRTARRDRVDLFSDLSEEVCRRVAAMVKRPPNKIKADGERLLELLSEYEAAAYRGWHPKGTQLDKNETYEITYNGGLAMEARHKDLRRGAKGNVR
jgi:transcriptional regulator with XRE-family HTH domain